jgi:hypothetical protein
VRPRDTRPLASLLHQIERFRREIVERTGDARSGENITDQELLREVMNTVGKHGQLGSIHCVVSVSMLTEGWDANTVTHVLGRCHGPLHAIARGTALLCRSARLQMRRNQSPRRAAARPRRVMAAWSTVAGSVKESQPRISTNKRLLLRSDLFAQALFLGW